MTARLVSLTQGTEEWMEFRKTTIGSSDAPAIMGVSPWSNPIKLWEEKVGLRDSPFMTDRMRRGHDLEEEARYYFEKDVGVTVMPLTYLHATNDWMSASFDGISFDEKTVVEIKCPGVVDHNVALQGKVPQKYYPQVQHQMTVAGVDQMFYMSYEDPSSYSILKVERDMPYVDTMIDLEKKFWDCVTFLKRPNDGYEDRTLDFMVNDEANRYISICGAIEELERQKEECRRKLIVYADDSNYRCGVLKVTKIYSRGRIKYDSIPELENVDLEKYRSKPTETYRIEKV